MVAVEFRLEMVDDVVTNSSCSDVLLDLRDSASLA